jgi:amino acid transporter
LGTLDNIIAQVFGVAFSIVGLLPSIAYDASLYRDEFFTYETLFRSVLFNAMPNGGPLAMVWGVRHHTLKILNAYTHCVIQWLFACAFIMCIGLAMAELASAAPTSGGVCPSSYHRYRHDLSQVSSCIIGPIHLPPLVAGIFSRG